MPKFPPTRTLGLLTGLSLALGLGCSPAPQAALRLSPPGPESAQVIDTTPEVLFIQIIEHLNGGYVVAHSTPSPEAVLAIRVPSETLVDGAILSCTKEGTALACEGSILEYAGCYAPEPVAQPPIVRAALIR